MNGQQRCALVLGSIVLLGLSGGAAASVTPAVASHAPAESGAGDLAAVQSENGQENETTESGPEHETIPITEALAVAANETNGTAVGAELGEGAGGLLADEGGGLVYAVDVLLDNGTHVETQVNATNGSVVRVQQADDGFLKGVFGSDNVPDQSFDTSEMYTATEAVELAQNESDANATVTQVSLNSRNDSLVYEVRMSGTDERRTTVIVDAARDGEGVIEVQRGGETVTGTGNESAG